MIVSAGRSAHKKIRIAVLPVRSFFPRGALISPTLAGLLFISLRPLGGLLGFPFDTDSIAYYRENVNTFLKKIFFSKSVDKPGKAWYNTLVKRKENRPNQKGKIMYEVYLCDEEERNETPEMICSSYDEAMDYILAEQDKYSEDVYFSIHDVKNDLWY